MTVDPDTLTYPVDPAPEPIRLLAPDGRLVDGAEPTLTVEEVVDAYKLMCLSRRIDERAFNLQRQGRLGTFSPTRGQEASVLGSGLALRPGTDWLVPQYRELTAMLYHNQPIDLWFAYWMGHMQGSATPDTLRILPTQIALAAQLPHAVGLAWGRKIQGFDDVVITYFGDGASSEGDFHEALNLAGVTKAPVIFFLQNNGWAISTPRSKQSAATSFAARGPGYGMPGVVVDGNDLLAVYEVSKRAAQRAREGLGPTLIESMTYRLGPHNTADDSVRYMDADELERRELEDPVTRIRLYLDSHDAWNDDQEETLAAEHKTIIDEAVAAAEAHQPEPERLFDHVFAEPTHRLADQRAQVLSNARGGVHA